jgi:hypothetical protein
MLTSLVALPPFDYRQALTRLQRCSIHHSTVLLHRHLLHPIITLSPSTMSQNTPDNLLKLAADLNKLGGELCTIGGKLATAATALEQEAANVAFANAQRWGVDVQVCTHDCFHYEVHSILTCCAGCCKGWATRSAVGWTRERDRHQRRKEVRVALGDDCWRRDEGRKLWHRDAAGA